MYIMQDVYDQQYVHILGPNAGIIQILETLGLGLREDRSGSREQHTDADPSLTPTVYT